MFNHAIKTASFGTPLALRTAAVATRQAAWLPTSAKQIFVAQCRADIFVGATLSRKGMSLLPETRSVASEAPKAVESVLGLAGATLGMLVGLGHGAYRALAYWVFASPQTAFEAWLQALGSHDAQGAQRAEKKLAAWSGLTRFQVAAAGGLERFFEPSTCTSPTLSVTLFKYAKEAPCGAVNFFNNLRHAASLLQASPLAAAAACFGQRPIWVLPPPPATQAFTRAVDHTPCAAFGAARLNLMGHADTSQKLRRIEVLWPVVKAACGSDKKAALERMLRVGDGGMVSDYALIVAGLAKSFYVAPGSQSAAYLAAYVHADRLPEQIWRRIYDFCTPQTLGNLASTHREAQIDISRRLSLKVDGLGLYLPFCLKDSYTLDPSPARRNQAALAIVKFHDIVVRNPDMQASVFGQMSHTVRNPLMALREAEPNTVLALTPAILPLAHANPHTPSGQYAALRIDAKGYPTLRTNMG